MEDEEIQSSGSMIPAALAVLAIVLGGAGLYFGLSANQRLSPISESVTAGGDSAARLEQQVAEVDTRLGELSAQLDEFEGRLKRTSLYISQNEQGIKKLASEINLDRGQIKELGDKLSELASKGVRAGAPAATARSNGAAEGGGGSDGSEDADSEDDDGEGTTYRIQSGDTFARIAAEHGVGLQQLLDANPTADPRRLRIGQEITIPAN
ncbi:MAG: LysM peptidoglycan-binding domain-containing protein [Opitutales bacterium]